MLKMMVRFFLYYVLLSSLAHALELDEARHLWGRTGYANTEYLLENYQNLSKSEAIDYILESATYTPTVTPQLTFDDTGYKSIKFSKSDKKTKRAFQENTVNPDRKRTSEWWHEELLNTNNQFQEKMTIFWHSHFTSDVGKVPPPFMFSQNQLFRKHALGGFKEMTYDVFNNPAIHWYLDNQKNKKGKLNENLAREMMELYTMGEGDHYNEDDVKSIARAISGVDWDYDNQKVIFKPAKSGAGFNTLLGDFKYYDLDAVIEKLLEQDITAEFITRKLWAEFISYDVNEERLKEFAKVFKDSDYDLKTVISEILNSKEFWDETNRNALVKSPYDMIASANLFLDYKSVEPRKFSWWLKGSGRRLFRPPDVKGWRGGLNWINADLILARRKLMNKVGKEIFKSYQQEFNDQAIRETNKKFDTHLRQLFAINEKLSSNIAKKGLKKKAKYVFSHDNFNFK